MRILIILLTVVASLVGCAAPHQNKNNSLNKFVMSGPVNVISSQLSMRWLFGVQLEVDKKQISSINFSCGQIPGTTFKSVVQDFRSAENGVILIDGPVLKISKEETPWLFEKSTTTENCLAVVKLQDKSQFSFGVRVNFSSIAKANILSDFKMAHDYNKILK